MGDLQPLASADGRPATAAVHRNAQASVTWCICEPASAVTQVALIASAANARIGASDQPSVAQAHCFHGSFQQRSSLTHGLGGNPTLQRCHIDVAAWIATPTTFAGLNDRDDGACDTSGPGRYEWPARIT